MSQYHYVILNDMSWKDAFIFLLVILYDGPHLSFQGFSFQQIAFLPDCESVCAAVLAIHAYNLYPSSGE
jgi:hypothetical protein